MKEEILTDEQIIEMLARTFDFYPDPICISSTDSRYLYINMPCVKLIGLRTPADFLERSYEETRAPICEDEKTIKHWKDQNKYIIDNPFSIIKMLEIHPGDMSCPYINRKISIHNANKTCIGSINHVKFLEVYRPNDFIKGKLPGSLLLNKPDDFFTEKECEIIFLKLQGMTSKVIANIIHRSHRTVENTIQSMHEKAGVSHTADFAEFCEKRNLHRYLPQRFINPERHTFSRSIQIEDEIMHSS